METTCNKSDLTKKIRQYALDNGFTDCGFSRVRELKEYEKAYQQWLEKGHNAGMLYMERNADKRLNPSLLVDNAKTVISFLVNYFTKEHISGSPVKIATYAYGTDYHKVIKAKLLLIDKFIKSFTNVNQRCFVDSAPVLERAWAQNSGLGWIGKNSCLISRKHGSFVFIAEIITSLELDYDEPWNDYCGTCHKCVDACPTKAINNNRTLDSKRCISYHTIENREEIPMDMKGKFENFVFGCDICQDVCPWNKNSEPHSEPLFNLRDDINNMNLQQWRNLDIDKYQKIFSGSAIKRTKYNGLKRNIKFVFD